MILSDMKQLIGPKEKRILTREDSTYHGTEALKKQRLHTNSQDHSVTTDDDSISIKGGCVITSKRNTIGCIEAKERVTGRAEIAAQLIIEIEDFPFHVAELSVGTHHHLNITYLDDLGNPFFQAYGAVPLLVNTNHPEVVSVKVTGVENKGTSTSGSFYVQALGQGRALV